MRRISSAYVFIAFPLTVLFVFTLAPTVLGLGLSLFTWDGSRPPAFVGLENFRGLLRDPKFGPALGNTLLFVLGTVPLTVLGGFFLAVAVQARWFVGRVFARTAFFLPTVVSIVAIGVVWRWLLDDAGGLIPGAIRARGFDPPGFLIGGEVIGFPAWLGLGPGLTWPMLSVIVVQVWRGVGFSMVLYLAALQNVNENLYEAAEVDGAPRRAVLRHITWPQVAPMTLFLLVTGVIGALQVFDLIWAMTATTETDDTRVLNLYVFREFQQSRLGYAAAIGVVVFALTALATAAQLAVARRQPA